MALSGQPPLPPPPVLTPPAGWLGYLGIKSGGAQPGTVNPQLITTIDMDRFYTAGARTQLVKRTAVAGALSFTTMGTVPQGKVWLLESAIAFSEAILGVAANIQGCIAVLAQNNQARWIEPIGSAVPTGDFLIFGSKRPDILLSGEVLAIFLTAPAAPTAFTMACNVWGLEVAA